MEELKLGSIYKVVDHEVFYYINKLINNYDFISAYVIVYDFENEEMICIYPSTMLSNEQVELWNGSIDELLLKKIEKCKEKVFDNIWT
jgi:hypothetical protein